LPAFDGETSRVVVDAEIEVLFELSHKLVTPEAAPAFGRYVSARLVPHRRALDAAKAAFVKANPKAPVKPNEDDALERRALFGALGALGNDPATLDEAGKLTVAWLADPTSVDGDLARVAVAIGSRKAGPDRIDALRAAMKAAKNPNDKKTALLALSDFDDPTTLGKALSVALTDDVPTQDVGILMMNAAYHPSTQAAAIDWVMSHWDAVRAKLPGFLVGRVFGIAGRACTKEEVDRASAFFTPKAVDVEGAPRPLAEALEGAAACQMLREKDAGAVDKFFNVVVAKNGATPVKGVVAAKKK
jgi:aminopeptidase N